MTIDDIDTALSHHYHLEHLFQSDKSFDKMIDATLLFIEFDELSYLHSYNIDDMLAPKITKSIKYYLSLDSYFQRVGDYQYIILLQNGVSSKELNQLIKQISNIFLEPISINDNLFYLTLSFGVSFSPKEGTTLYTLVKKAKYALKSREKFSQHSVITSEEIFTSTSYLKMTELMKDLPLAIENGEITWEYQPQYDYEKNAYTGAEMLARWKHPKYGDVSPEIFIPLAEETGMIAPLTVKLFIETSHSFKILEKNHINDFSLSINISPVFLMSKTFYTTIDFFISEYDLYHKKLHFEITEQILIKDIYLYSELFDKLKKLNIHIALDDFGTGYTSFNYLSELPISSIKIDKSLIKDIDKNLKNRTIVNAIYHMSQALNLDVIVEGVENSAENSIIKNYVSIKSQGYYHAKPMSLKELILKLIP